MTRNGMTSLQPVTTFATSSNLLPDGPEHEDDGGDEGKGKGVCEVCVEGQLDQVVSQTKGSRCLHHGCEDPEADGRLQQGQWE